jgi:hypothetical protein
MTFAPFVSVLGNSLTCPEILTGSILVSLDRMTAVYVITYGTQAVMSVTGKGRKIITKGSQNSALFVTTRECARED